MGLLNPKKAAQAKVEEVKGQAKALPGAIAQAALKATCRRCQRELPKVQLKKDGTSRQGASFGSRGKVVQLWVCKNGRACSNARQKGGGTEGLVTFRGRRNHPGPLSYGTDQDD